MNLRLFEQTPATIRNLILDLKAEDLDWQPAPERFSITMVLAHLAEVEVETISGRIQLVMSEDNPALPAYDQEALFHKPKKFDAAEALDRFTKLRAETVAILKGLPAAAMDRTGRHEHLGVLRLEEILNECMFHDLGHIKQIVELYRARVFYPRMGAFRTYYKVNP